MKDTRRQILEAIYADIKKYSFQGMRPDRAIADLDITKGAMYHHFKNKQEMLYAVIDEIIAPNLASFAKGFDSCETGDPIAYLCEMFSSPFSENHVAQIMKDGDVFTKLVNEMSGLDDVCRKRFLEITKKNFDALCQLLQRGKDEGYIKESVNVEHVSYFIFSVFEGLFSTMKMLQKTEIEHMIKAQLKDYLSTLKK